MSSWIVPRTDEVLNIPLKDEFTATLAPGIKHVLDFVDHQMTENAKFSIYADFQNSHVLAQNIHFIAQYYTPTKCLVSIGHESNLTHIVWVEKGHYASKHKYDGRLATAIKQTLND